MFPRIFDHWQLAQDFFPFFLHEHQGAEEGGYGRNRDHLDPVNATAVGRKPGRAIHLVVKEDSRHLVWKKLGRMDNCFDWRSGIVLVGVIVVLFQRLWRGHEQICLNGTGVDLEHQFSQVFQFRSSCHLSP